MTRVCEQGALSFLQDAPYVDCTSTSYKCVWPERRCGGGSGAQRPVCRRIALAFAVVGFLVYGVGFPLLWIYKVRLG